MVFKSGGGEYIGCPMSGFSDMGSNADAAHAFTLPMHPYTSIPADS